MTYEDYTTRLAPLMLRYKNAERHNCRLTANARLRDMAKLYSEYRGIPLGEAMTLFREKLSNNIIPV